VNLSPVEMLERLVAFDSETPRSNLPLIAFVAEYLTAHGIPFVTAPNAAGDKAALLATVGPLRDGGIVLSGHTDVVPVAGQAWTSDPFTLRRDGGRLYGRGACDMKGFDAVCLAALPALARLPLKAPVHVLLSYDEETTCLGVMDIIAMFGVSLPRPRAVIVGEPSQMRVADAHKSVVTFRTTVTGFEHHSAHPRRGVNAIRGAAALVGEIDRLAEEYEAKGDPTGRFDPACTTIHVGEIRGGTARNITARECVFHWEFRGVPGLDNAEIPARLAEFGERVVLPGLRADGLPAGIVTVNDVAVPGLAPDPGSAAESLALRLTGSNRTITVPYGSEAGRFQQAGVPTVICGPGNIEQAHQPDEWILESEIEACAAFVRRLGEDLAA
jgi:acetylornithine deacetylase